MARWACTVEWRVTEGLGHVVLLAVVVVVEANRHRRRRPLAILRVARCTRAVQLGPSLRRGPRSRSAAQRLEPHGGRRTPRRGGGGIPPRVPLLRRRPARLPGRRPFLPSRSSPAFRHLRHPTPHPARHTGSPHRELPRGADL